MWNPFAKIFLSILLFLPLLVAAHFFAFPSETRCILIDFSHFKKQQNLYCIITDPPEVVSSILSVKAKAENRVQGFWQDASAIDYKLIYCNTDGLYKKYGQSGAPAVTNLKMGAYVVIPAGMFDEDILAHEISHTVLYRKIGWYNLHFKIPAWFNEGLAMQVDNRNYYSIDTLLARKKAGLVLPDVTTLKNLKDFYSGSQEQVMLNYSVSKYLVHEWLKAHSIGHFITSINSGSNFEESYRR